jgi:hydroxysqualene dehydroxylase
MTIGTVYVIGAGLAGLSAAVMLSAKGAQVSLIEGAGQAGGRCRSYFDPTLNQVIDNGNHLVLSGNRATYEYLAMIGAEDRLIGPEQARFAFADLRTAERWTIAPNEGMLPWWVLVKGRRVPETSMLDYLKVAKLLRSQHGRRVDEVTDCRGPLWERLVHPLLLAALNTEPEMGSSELATAIVRATLAKGGRAYRPRFASPSLGDTFVEPALSQLKANGVAVRFGEHLRALIFDGSRVTALGFARASVTVDVNDLVVLATPAWVTQDLVPQITAPNEFRAIVNAHFAIAPPDGAPLMTGIIGGTAEWVFAFPDRISVTVSAADGVVNVAREELVHLLWRDVAALYGLGLDLPPWQIVKERRATFAATPEQVARRPKTETAWTNLFLAGDWTDTGLPATIEGAVRSGHRAAELALRIAARH